MPQPVGNHVELQNTDRAEDQFIGDQGPEDLGGASFAQLVETFLQCLQLSALLHSMCYFDNSYKNLVAYFAQEDKINQKELEEILELIKKQKPKP